MPTNRLVHCLQGRSPRFCTEVKHTSDLPDLSLHKILGGIKVPVDKKATIPFAQASTQQLRSFLFFHLTKIDLLPKDHTGAHFGEQKIHASSRNFWWRSIHHAISTAAFSFYKWHTAPSPESLDCHDPQEELSHYIFLCPAKRVAWTQILHEYTDKVDWSDQELENFKLSCPGLQILIQKRYPIKPTNWLPVVFKESGHTSSQPF